MVQSVLRARLLSWACSTDCACGSTSVLTALDLFRALATHERRAIVQGAILFLVGYLVNQPGVQELTNWFNPSCAPGSRPGRAARIAPAGQPACSVHWVSSAHRPHMSAKFSSKAQFRSWLVTLLTNQVLRS